MRVLQGGFATGTLLAGGELLPHECSRLIEIGAALEVDNRQILNAYFLTEQGQVELTQLLKSGCFDLSFPEEGALAVVAWLLRNGHSDSARELVGEIGPFFKRLRFYPVPVAAPRRIGPWVFLQDVRCTIQSLRRIEPNQNVLAQKETLQVWSPLYDRLVEIFLETVQGYTPELGVHSDNGKQRQANGRYAVLGGWPCHAYAPDWKERAQKLLKEYEEKRTKHKVSSKPDRRNESFYLLIEYLRRCIADSNSLTGKDVGRIRIILARYVSKRGAPGSASCAAERENERKLATAPSFYEIAGVLIERLSKRAQDDGIDDIQRLPMRLLRTKRRHME